MTVAAVLMVRDEQDVIGYTIAHLLAEGIDHILIADNNSEDDTRRILDQFTTDGRVTVVDEPGFYEGETRTRYPALAHEMWGCEWVLPCDADELFYSPHGGTLGEFFARCDADVLTATGWDHIATDDDDFSVPNPFLRSPWRRQTPQRMGKVAFRWHPDAVVDFGNHFVKNHPGQHARALRYRHLQYRSFDQMLQKVRQGAKATEDAGIHPTYNAHWRELDALSDEVLYKRWRRLCDEQDLIHDPVPIR